MKTNEGAIDRTLRVLAGGAILTLLVAGPVPGWGLWGLVGLAPLVTGLTGFCPTYTLFSIDTRNGGGRAARPTRFAERDGREGSDEIRSPLR